MPSCKRSALQVRSTIADRLRALAAASIGVDAGDERVHVVSDDDPAEAIARRAAELESCVVCLTSHGRGRLRGAVVGSVARSVLQRSVEAMVALGPMADQPGWSPRPRRWPEPLSVPRMVACVDGSDTSEQVLPLAASWARALDMSLTILTVVADVPEPLRPDQLPTRYGAGVAPESYIESLVQQWGRILPSVDGEVVPDPISAAGGIRAHLNQRPAGLVAVTTHARSGLQRALLGRAGREHRARLGRAVPRRTRDAMTARTDASPEGRLRRRSRLSVPACKQSSSERRCSYVRKSSLARITTTIGQAAINFANVRRT